MAHTKATVEFDVSATGQLDKLRLDYEVALGQLIHRAEQALEQARRQNYYHLDATKELSALAFEAHQTVVQLKTVERAQENLRNLVHVHK